MGSVDNPLILIGSSLFPSSIAPTTTPSLAIASSLIKKSPDIEPRARLNSLKANSKFVAPPARSLLVKNTPGASLTINSNFFPKALKIFRSGPSMLYSTAASTGGPESNLSTIIFRPGFSEVSLLASSGSAFFISL